MGKQTRHCALAAYRDELQYTLFLPTLLLSSLCVCHSFSLPLLFAHPHCLTQSAGKTQSNCAESLHKPVRAKKLAKFTSPDYLGNLVNFPLYVSCHTFGDLCSSYLRREPERLSASCSATSYVVTILSLVRMRFTKSHINPRFFGYGNRIGCTPLLTRKRVNEKELGDKCRKWIGYGQPANARGGQLATIRGRYRNSRGRGRAQKAQGENRKGTCESTRC
ncbi:hypothetical protein B0T25DRAFT_523745 [Lasiosphaeria hispida]|uniref:Transmembrane protein n=1 Tax=Lasiosphaeria hispida TaxID=260671 RepID=A0AAJ0MIX8_9PEZI|nr:hypothetical protein B0T25DRAFT_557308 [Lasiosphaeria hispida]KAK3362205.1 hypothetical protein B0T25DRAFT_523745 [Lasiosphaeria hispida]